MKIACWLENGSRCVGVVDGNHVRKIVGIHDVQTLILRGLRDGVEVRLDSEAISPKRMH